MMRAMTSSACRAPSSVRAASSGVLPPISGCGVVRKRRACSRSCQTSSAVATTRAKRSVRSLSAGLRRSREDVPRHIAKGCLGQAAFDGVIQLQERCDSLTQNAVAAQDLSNMAWFQHKYHYTPHSRSDDATSRKPKKRGGADGFFVRKRFRQIELKIIICLSYGTRGQTGLAVNFRQKAA